MVRKNADIGQKMNSLLLAKMPTLRFCQGMGFTRIFEKNGEKNCENWSENEITSFGENAITLIFAEGGDSPGFSKKMVKKTAKIGQKMNSVSYLYFLPLPYHHHINLTR